MKILIIGNGGREHALAYKCARSSLTSKVFVAPGNAGTHREPKVENIAIDVLDFDKLADFAANEKVEFTIVGPEAPLVEGIVDYFYGRNLKILGPNQFAAQLEGSKSFAKQFMLQNNIPTAKAKTFNNIDDAENHLKNHLYPVVIKADGLAAGKGVVIAQNFDEAHTALQSMLVDKQFGDASNEVLIEEFLTGEEASFIALCDGTHAIPLATSQDHKARDDGDKGPNTGGMGAYSPAPIIDAARHNFIMQNIIQPVLDGMQKSGHPFVGFLYAGLMVTENNNIKVLEFNVRFGDPETQPILMRLKSDFVDACLHALNGDLDQIQLDWDKRSACGVVLAAQGYPKSYVKGDNLGHLAEIPASEDYKIFHAGTKMHEGKIETCGGRVLCVTALGDTLQDAHDNAYQIVNEAKWPNCFYRTDIGHKGL